MAKSRTSNTDFGRAFGEAQKNATGFASDAVDAAQDVYDFGLEGGPQNRWKLRTGPEKHH